MNTPRSRSTALILTTLVLATASPVLTAADRIIPQIADGVGNIRTKIDITNLSSDVAITRMKIYFFNQDGTPWTLATNLGTANEFPFELGRSQVIRIETLGLTGRIAAGYAVIRNSEGNPSRSSDYQNSISVFYEVLDGVRVVDTVSVPVPPPTRRWAVPVEIDPVRNIYSGIALVNLSGEANRITLQLWSSFVPASVDATDWGKLSLTLNPREHMAKFLNEPNLFSGVPAFKGMLIGTAEKPVSALGLLQTRVSNGVQYSTLAAEYLDALRSESYVYLPQALSLDADIPTVPWATVDDSDSFDVLYQFISGDVRNFIPRNGATLAPIGIRSAIEFNNLALEDIQRLNYASTPLDLSDISGNLTAGYTLALRTSLGRHVKLRFAQVVGSGSVKDLVVQVFIYR